MNRVKPVLRVIVSICLFLAILLMMVVGLARFLFLNPSYYTKTVLTDEYYDSVMENVTTSVQEECAILEVTAESMMKFVDRQTVERLSTEYVASLFTAMIGGGEMSETSFDNPAMKPVIREQLEAFASQNHLEVKDDSVDQIYKVITSAVDRGINILPLSTMQHFQAVFAKLYQLNRLTDIVWVFVGVSAILVIVQVLLNRPSRSKTAFSIAAPIWLASCLMFILAMMLYFYRVSERLKMADSPVKWMVSSVLDAVSGHIFATLTVLFVLATILLIVAIVWKVDHMRRRDKAKRYRAQSMENQEE